MELNDIQIRDPFIVLHKNVYYLYGSTDTDIWVDKGQGFNAYSSIDLCNWDGPFTVFKPPSDYWGTRNFWAPEIHVYNNEFFMFASFIGDGFNRGTAVLKAENPLGPFIPWSEGAVTPAEHMCLDGTLYIDENAVPWLVYCHEWVQIGDGTICAVRMSTDLKYAVSEPIILFKSSDAPWSKTVFSKSNNIEGYVTDGCFLYKAESGKLFMLWSCFSSNGYCQCYAVSSTGKLTDNWEHASILFDENGGHGMVFRDLNNKLTLTLHTPNKSPDERAVLYNIEETGQGLIITKRI
jgi:GH43 family beta-xylosidase